MSFGQQMKGSMVLLATIVLFATIQSFDAFSLTKRHSPLFQLNPFWGYRDFAEQNDLSKPGLIGVEIRQPILRPLSNQDFDERNEDGGLQNKAKKPKSIGVEIKEPIVRPFNYQDFAEKNEDLKERISFIISRFLEDMGLQNIPKNPGSNGVEIREPIVQPVRFEEPLMISDGKYTFLKC